MINCNDIEFAWNALTAKTEKEGWQTISITETRQMVVMAAKHYPNATEGLLIGFKNYKPSQKIPLPSGNGFKVAAVAINEMCNSWFVLEREAAGSTDFFTIMAVDILNLLNQKVTLGDRAVFRHFIGRIKAWQQFMKDGANTMSVNSQLGLMGELCFLRQLLETDIPQNIILQGWLGPACYKQDFLIGTGAVEVKSTLSSEGFPATIQSLTQLDDSKLSPIILAAFKFSLCGSGQSLPDMVEDIRRKLKRINDGSSETFNSKLISAGYLNQHSHQYNSRYTLLANRLYLVDDSFPRLTNSNVPQGIIEARYTLELSRLESNYSLSDAVNMLGIK